MIYYGGILSNYRSGVKSVVATFNQFRITKKKESRQKGGQKKCMYPILYGLLRQRE